MKTVAVVDDNAANRLLVEAMLEDHYEVVGYASGRAALEAFHHRKPDLVLLDISMAGLGGVQTLKKLRADDALSRLPVIALTARFDDDRARYLAVGFDDYMMKPVNEVRLLKALSRWLDGE
jgi:two-component system, cell cycle response regulator DivK